MSDKRILWVDDEIDSLKSQIIFLENKGYEIKSLSNGYDAIEYLKTNIPDVVLLDESMPGLTGLETLQKIKEEHSSLPVVMITKNETENLMDEAIGAQISDYLIKPVNPNQVWSSLKKLIDNNRLVAQKTTSEYQQEFRNIMMSLNDGPDYHEWMEIYKKLVGWELRMKKSESPEMLEVFNMQKKEANTEFFKFISKNYADWMSGNNEDSPVLSFNLMKKKVFPKLQKGTPLFFILVDNLRFDQWKVLEPLFSQDLRVLEEDTFYAILPTATQYSRNAIFAGLRPIDIEKRFPDEWKNDNEKGGKNLFEELFFKEQMKRMGKSGLKYSYTKVVNNNDAHKLVDNIHNLLDNDINIIVYNFVDMLSHARTEVEVLKELAGDEASYRSITSSWFEHSPLREALRKIADRKFDLILSTDHGSVRVNNPIKVVGDKETTPNLRYKHGRNLSYNAKDVLAFKDPRVAGLPVPNVNSSFIFAKMDDYLCYPNNFGHFANYYKNTFQHGGVSLEEMIVPIIAMTSKN